MLLSDIKKMLIEDPHSIEMVLQAYDYCHIRIKTDEIRFARDDAGGQNISIRLKNNDGVYVRDFVTSDALDIIAYIMKYRGETFSGVLHAIQKALHLSDGWSFKTTESFFGGFYDSIGSASMATYHDYPECIMDQYDFVGNKRFLRDGISLETQKKYDVHYCVEEDLIVFPWRSAVSGNIVAVKARINYPQEDGPKYFYIRKGQVSETLYGYSENYKNLFHADVIMVFEAEKSVMWCDSNGIYNAVALGSNSLSATQAELIMSLEPKEVWFMLDRDLPLIETKKNIKVLQDFGLMRETKIKYWNWKNNTSVCEKGAPVDMGTSVFREICENEMEEVK